MMARTQIRDLKGRLMLALFARGTIRTKLQYLIQTNKLYTVEDAKQKVVKNGEKVSKSRVEVSARAEWKKEKNEHGDTMLILRFLKTGSVIDSQLLGLTAQLQALFNAKLERRTNQVGWVEYRLLYKQSKDKEVYYLYDCLEVDKKGYIELNRYHRWQPSKPAHLLLAGKSGSGKTFLLNKLVHQMMSETDWNNIYILDGKMAELKKYATNMLLPNVAKNIDDIADYVRLVNEKMMNLYEREEELEEPIFLVFDELIAATLYLERDKKKLKEFQHNLTNLLVLGRSVGVNVVLASQRISQDQFGNSAMRGQFGVKIQLGNPTADDYKMMFDQTRNESEMLERGIGEGYISFDNSDVMLFERSNISDRQ